MPVGRCAFEAARLPRAESRIVSAWPFLLTYRNHADALLLSRNVTARGLQDKANAHAKRS